MSSPPEEEASGWEIALGCLGGLLYLALIVGFYFGTLWLLRLYPHPEVGTGAYALGAGAMLFTIVGFALAGEGLYEDFVKFVLIGGAGIFIALRSSPAVATAWLGVVVGSFLPLAMRVGERAVRLRKKS